MSAPGSTLDVNINIPFGLPEDVKLWNPGAVYKFFQANQDSYFLDEEDLEIVKSQKIAGCALLGMKEADFLYAGLVLGPVKSILTLVAELKKAKGLFELAPSPAGLDPRKRTRAPQASIDSFKREKLEVGYKEIVQDGLGASSLSAVTKPAETPAILNGRPHEQTGPPVVLFHPVFGEFLRDMNDRNLAIPDRIYHQVEDLFLTAADFYDDESAHRTSIKEALGMIWGHIGSASYGKHRYSSDGVLLTDVHSSVAYRMILELENEVGAGSTDPTLRLALNYHGYWSQEDTQLIKNRSCCPTFGVVIAGPWMCILGAVFLDKAVVQPLTPFLPLVATPSDDQNLGRISRMLVALGSAFTKLQTFYKDVMDFHVDLDPRQRCYPHFREFVDSTNSLVPFTYLSQLPVPEERTELVWKATTTQDQLIVVKFTPRYNKAAHVLCAENDLAPPVLYYGKDVKLGQFHVVVMPYIDHQPLVAAELSLSSLHIRKKIFTDIQGAINLLHNKKYVFAVFRDPNILIINKQGDLQAVLIDFEWCGKEGEDIYPLSTRRRIGGPRGVHAGGLLGRQYDLIWLRELRKNLKLERDVPDPAVVHIL